ncbi:hypothetical protein W909_06415 [Dickeya zeae EC1]|nr:hypothetical protein W909_06415 [Dickeya zeae EC1]
MTGKRERREKRGKDNKEEHSRRVLIRGQSTGGEPAAGTSGMIRSVYGLIMETTVAAMPATGSSPRGWKDTTAQACN